MLLRGPKHHGLYQIKLPSDCHSTALRASNNPSALWQARLGHPHSRLLRSLVNHIPELASSTSSLDACVFCNVSKSHELPFSSSISSCNKPFQLVHSDVWGPTPVASLNGFIYYVLFIDDFSKFSWLYLLNSKHETFAKFQQFHNLVKNKFGTNIQTLRCDGGGEFTSTKFRNYLLNQGITHQVSCPYTSEQNGTAERKHRHLLDSTRTLLHAAYLPPKFWAEAVTTANYFINQLPSATLSNHTPYFLLHNRSASYIHLHTFGCLCFPWTKMHAPTKLSPRSTECVFLGY
ncbi:hypothetical protein KFK09_020094 [Dendrobium nobile]|uniref:Integrase catalytic domain-containing protein n=1 Tax=Dendrobium nobile TaxID=94219 RepID=A0A8T3AU07_DENNO|nr:hypothetical protein KFK09_020094 [Dendrobium nobile]